MNLGQFLNETKNQYANLLISSGLAPKSQLSDILAKLDTLHDGRIVENSELGGGIAEIITSKSHPPRLLLTQSISEDIYSAQSTNAVTLDNLRKTVFHEFTHLLQLNREFSNAGFNKANEHANSLNEVAAAHVENVVMAQYYREVNGFENAGILKSAVTLNNQNYNIYGAVKDTSKQQSLSASSYFKEISLTENIMKQYNISLNDLAQASFDFNQTQQKIIEQIGKEKFDDICFNLETVTVYDRQQPGEKVVTDDEFKKAIEDLNKQTNNDVKRENQTFNFNEFGEIIRDTDELTTTKLNNDIPTFEPPSHNNDNGITPINDNENPQISEPDTKKDDNANEPEFDNVAKESNSALNETAVSLITDEEIDATLASNPELSTPEPEIIIEPLDNEPDLETMNQEEYEGTNGLEHNLSLHQ